MAQIRPQIVIEAPAAKAFPLVSTGGGFKQWWAADVTEKTPPPSSDFSNATPCIVCSLRAPGEAEWRSTTGEEWDGTRSVFALKEDQGKTTVRFTHADWKAETDYFVSCNTTWGALMFRLKAAAEGKTPGPLFSMEGRAY